MSDIKVDSITDLAGTGAPDFPQGLNTSGFTSLGDASTGIKMKVLTGTTAASDGGSTNIAHGLGDSDLIVAAYGVVQYAANNLMPVPQGWVPTGSDGYTVKMDINNTDIQLQLESGNSGNILSKPVRIVLLYTETVVV